MIAFLWKRSRDNPTYTNSFAACFRQGTRGFLTAIFGEQFHP